MPTSVFMPAGNVVGPASATDSGFAQYDGTTGQLVKNHAASVAIASEVSGLGTNDATFLATPSSANLLAATTDETGTGALVFGTAPTITLPNATGLPVGTGLSGLGTGVATFLGTPSSANLASAVTGETGSGALVFADTPTLVTPNIGAATGASVALSGNVRGASFNVGATAGVDASIVIPAVATITVSKGIITAVV